MPAIGAHLHVEALAGRLQSGYEYSFDVGFTYTFGSIFNNVVNPRFGQ